MQESSAEGIMHQPSLKMGSLNFFTGKNKVPEPMTEKADRPECDISKTEIMVELFSVPKEQRDGEWTTAFYDNVKTASYACGNPQIFQGPDGFPYFILRTPEPDTPFESFCIQNMKDDFLLERGLGVAINPRESAVDWVFSYGDIVNLHINNELFTNTGLAPLASEEIVQQDEEILIAQPSESYLPNMARQHLKSFLQHLGMKRPQMMMVCRKTNSGLIQELAFNIFREDFESTEQLNFRLQQISWFLPRHYVLLVLPKEENFTSGLADL